MKQKLLFLFAFFFVTTSAWANDSANGQIEPAKAESEDLHKEKVRKLLEGVLVNILSNSEVAISAGVKTEAGQFGAVARASIKFKQSTSVSPDDYGPTFSDKIPPNLKLSLPVVELGSSNLRGQFQAVKKLESDDATAELVFYTQEQKGAPKIDAPFEIKLKSNSDSEGSNLFSFFEGLRLTKVNVDAIGLFENQTKDLKGNTESKTNGPVKLSNESQIKISCTLELLGADENFETTWRPQQCLADITYKRELVKNKEGKQVYKGRFIVDRLEVGENLDQIQN